MSLKKAAEQIRRKGRNQDTELVHMTRSEVAGLSALAKRVTGKPLPKNPDTGLPEANILKSMLPTILGAAASFVGTPALGAAVGAAAGAAMNPEDRWGGAAMGALGGYGGGQLAQGLTAAGAGAASTAGNAAATGAAETAASEATKQSLIAQQSMGLGAEQAAANAGASAAEQAAAQQAMSAATAQTAQQGTMDAAAQRAGQAWDGFKSLGTTDGWDKFIGSAATKDTAATGMGGGYNTMMAAGKAAAPAMMAPASSGGGEEDMGELPRFRFDRKRGSGYAAGAGASSEQDWFDDSFTRLAEGGAVEAGPTTKVPQQARVSVGRGTHSEGMSGMSKDAMEYLMGRGTIKAPQAAVPPPNVGMPTSGFAGPDRTYQPVPSRDMVSATAGYGGGFLTGLPAARQRIMMSEYAKGGTVDMESNGFVIPADVVSAVGSGSSNAGIEILAKRLGAKPIHGAGDGQSDSIPARIDGKHPARVARDEMYLSPQQVEQAGGAKKLYAMMDRIRKDATGSKKQARPVKLDKAIK